VLRALLQACRPRQWVKNVFVLAPVIFSKHGSDLPQAERAVAATLLFCGLSSTVYLLNDLVDIERDRAHPKKRERPIASGRLPRATAQLAAVLLGVGGLLLGLRLGVDFALAAGAYLVGNVVYSLWLKHVVYLDVISIAVFFLLRVTAGALAIPVWMSPYLLICTALLACFFGFGKRAHELAAATSSEKAEAQRSVLRSYRKEVLDVALVVTGILTLGAYVLYTLSAHTVGFFHTTRMIWTAPFAGAGLLRFRWLVTRREIHDSPTDAMLKDPPFVTMVLAWAVGVMAIIYFRP
jgi:4-hydroxybenzoate polyprenyltransferase